MLENSFHKSNYKKNLAVSIGLAVVFCLTTYGANSYVYASSDAYDSGRDHGCDDAGISNPSDRYINQPERGPSFHTNEFMNGYHAGFRECSGAATSDSSDNGDDTDDSSPGGQTENRGIFGNYADGHRAGLAAGAADYRSGNTEFARCPGGSLDYCAGYDFGYHDGYDAARKVG